MDASPHRTDARYWLIPPSDPGAFAAFYRRYERAMLAYFQRRTHDAELAADLTAEVFAAALEAAALRLPTTVVSQASASMR